MPALSPRVHRAAHFGTFVDPSERRLRDPSIDALPFVGIAHGAAQ
jgi:hypothetical protein